MSEMKDQPRQNLDTKLSVRVSGHQRDAFLRAADRCGVSLSNWLVGAGTHHLEGGVPDRLIGQLGALAGLIDNMRFVASNLDTDVRTLFNQDLDRADALMRQILEEGDG